MSGWVSEWVMFSDFGDSYRIYWACELVRGLLDWNFSTKSFLRSSELFWSLSTWKDRLTEGWSKQPGGIKTWKGGRRFPLHSGWRSQWGGPCIVPPIRPIWAFIVNFRSQSNQFPQSLRLQKISNQQFYLHTPFNLIKTRCWVLTVSKIWLTNICLPKTVV